MRAIVMVLPLALLAGCNGGGGAPEATSSTGASKPVAAAAGDPLISHDPAPGQAATQDMPDSEARPLMQAQVVLDRQGFTPGVIDGKPGLSTRNAVTGFQQANGLPQTGEFDDATRRALARWNNIPATRVVTIPDDFARGPFYAVPKKPDEQAKMTSLGYASLDEKLAERFHTTVDTLKALNPGGVPAGAKGGAPVSAAPSEAASASLSTDASSGASDAPFTPQPGPPSFFHAGQQIRVPNTGADAIQAGAVDDQAWQATLVALGVGSSQPKVDKIVVSKSGGTLRAFDKAGKLVAMYTATMGSTHDPLPIGEWKVMGLDRNPKFNFNPALFWDAKPGDKKALLPPGPNGPVGVVWIDLNKPHYGIHGTPSPETIGRAQSHGCVRLTNWDAARLALMVSPGTQVVFEK